MWHTYPTRPPTTMLLYATLNQPEKFGLEKKQPQNDTEKYIERKKSETFSIPLNTLKLKWNSYERAVHWKEQRSLGLDDDKNSKL